MEVLPSWSWIQSTVFYAQSTLVRQTFLFVRIWTYWSYDEIAKTKFVLLSSCFHNFYITSDYLCQFSY